MPTLPEEILAFWFQDALDSATAAQARCAVWFRANPRLDAEIRGRFADLPERAIAGEFDHWLETPRSALARILVLDQFPRNLHRGSPRAFAFDSRALDACRRALSLRLDEALHPVESIFVYLPLEHSENRQDQSRCVSLFEALEERAEASYRSLLQHSTDYARRHRDVILRFGRFPHRNAILGRAATQEEVAFLEADGDTF